ncbi:MAG: permease [Pseudomonadota bacterium]
MNWIIDIPLSIFTMIWNVAWALCLGFLLSATIQALVSTETVQKQLGKTSPRSLSLATFFGAVSSSCSYAAASMSKSLFEKGASLPVSSAFLVASTNLVLEIMLVIWILMGWQFVVGELIGGLVLVLLISVLMPVLINTRRAHSMWMQLKQKEKQSNMEGGCGASMEGGCGSAMEGGCGSAMEGGCGAHHSAGAGDRRLQSICRSFRMEVGMVGKDILIGLVIAAILSVTVPTEWWSTLFMAPEDGHHPGWGVLLWNAIIGPLIAVVAFVCSVGNIVLASVLWAGGISFGGVMAFILADIITLPMLKVYASYYGWPSALRYGAVLFLCIVITALALDALFLAADLTPSGERNAHVMTLGIELNYTSALNVIFVPLAIWAWIRGGR